MLIQCEKCQNKYNLDESKIPGKGAKVTCPSCKNVFIVMKDGSAAPPVPAPPRQPLATPTQPSMPPPGSKSLLDSFFDDGKTIPGAPFPSAPGASPAAPPRGIKSWKVRVASGLVYDFTDPSTLKNWIAEKKVTPGDSISGDGAGWTPIGSIPNLDAFFGVAPPLGAPGMPPATGFGPAPAGAPVAPAFTPPGAGAGPSLGDLFSSAPTNPGNPAPSGNPFQPSFNAAIPGSFAPPPPRGPSNDPFAGLGSDPFGAAPAPPPWGAAAAAPAENPFAVPDRQQPLPPPWNASAAPGAPPPAASPSPASPASIGPAWGAGVDSKAEPTSKVVDAPPPTPPPPKEPLAPKPSRRGGRGLGRIIGLALGGALVLAIIAGVALHKDDLLRMLHPPPVITPGAVTPVATGPLEGEAKTKYLLGRRYLRIDTVDAYGKAAAAFRAALAKAPNNPKAEAGVLEALALEVQANGNVGKDELDKAFADANGAFKDDLHGLETNRAIAQYYVSTKQPEQAKPYLDTALAAKPDDPESLYLRGAMERADKATLEAAKADIAAAAKDPDLTRAHKAHAELSAPGTPEQRSAQAMAAALVAANIRTEAALDAGSWKADPTEEERLLPGSAAATPEATATAVAVATTAAPTATPTLVAVATPASTVTATPAPTATPKPTTTATPAPTKTPKPTPTPAPTKTPVAVKSAPAPTPTAIAKLTPAPTPVVKLTPEPTPTPVVKLTPPPTPAPTGGATVASAGAEDHYVAGNAFLEAGSVGDAINEFDAAVKAAPSVTKYQIALAAAMMRGGRKADAAQVLADITENEPRNAEAHRLLGLIFESTEQLAQACGEFDDYLRYAPTGRDAGDIRARKSRDCGE